MLAGLPVVAANVSSLPELVVDGETGFLVRPDDPSALALGVARGARAARGSAQAGATRAHARVLRRPDGRPHGRVYERITR